MHKSLERLQGCDTFFGASRHVERLKATRSFPSLNQSSAACQGKPAGQGSGA
ncbi:MAG: hypothetical protein IKP44_02225 [Bacteroidaceae bacterium]|nr:hypothetical protein [Bacteroidaceae bacterium]